MVHQLPPSHLRRPVMAVMGAGGVRCEVVGEEVAASRRVPAGEKAVAAAWWINEQWTLRTRTQADGMAVSSVFISIATVNPVDVCSYSLLPSAGSSKREGIDRPTRIMNTAEMPNLTVSWLIPFAFSTQPCGIGTAARKSRCFSSFTEHFQRIRL